MSMNRTFRYLLLFLLFDALVVGGYLLIRSMGAGSTVEVIPWTVVDESYAPRGTVEEFIKADAERQGALPIEIRNYGRDAKILGRFRGKQFAGPTESVLALFFKGLSDWTVVDIRYKTETEREVVRTMLYVLDGGQWKVGDSGTLRK
jgi:hypothetical protein